jgi:hypothetical protein
MNDGKDGFIIIKLSVPLKVLSELYERLKTIDVPPIETLPENEKLKYWAIAKKYYSIETEAVMASKAAYMLSLITNY